MPTSPEQTLKMAVSRPAAPLDDAMLAFLRGEGDVPSIAKSDRQIIEEYLGKDAEFESKHPRDEAGRFAEKAGGFSPELEQEIKYQQNAFAESAEQGERLTRAEAIRGLMKDMDDRRHPAHQFRKELQDFGIDAKIFKAYTKEQIDAMAVSSHSGRKYDFRRGDTYYIFDSWSPLEKIAKAWDESKHPRDDRGRWTDAGASGAAPRQFTSEEGYRWHEEGPVWEWANKLDPERVRGIVAYASFEYGEINGILRGELPTKEVTVRLATDEERKNWFDGSPPALHEGERFRFDALKLQVVKDVVDEERVADVQEKAVNINRTIREHGYVLPEPIQVGRGAYIPGLTADQLRGMVGETYTEKGFTSTMVGDAGGRLNGYAGWAKSESIYRRFGKLDRELYDEPGVAIRFAINLPKGTRVAAVEALRQSPSGNRKRYAGDTAEDRKANRTESELLLGSGATFRIRSVSRGTDYKSSDDTVPVVPVWNAEMDYIGGGASEP